MKTYTTISGDTFDKIAYDQWGSEYSFPLLLDANPQYRHILIFNSGVVLNIPDVDQDEYMEVPDWIDNTNPLDNEEAEE